MIDATNLSEKEAKDAELLRLAQASTEPSIGDVIPPQTGAGTGQTLGLDLPVIPAAAVPTPNGLPVEGPIEVPGDRALEPPPIAAPAPIAPPMASAPLSEQGGVQALEQARQSAGGVAAAQEGVGAAKSQEAVLNADSQDQIAAQQRDNAVEIQVQQAAQEEGRLKAQAVADKAAATYKDFKFQDFWKDLADPQKTSDGERIKAKIFMFLGGFLQRSNGGRNASFDEINSIIEQAHKRDVSKLHQREQWMNWAKEGVTDLGARYRDEVATLRLKQSALTQATADEAKAQLIRNGIPADEAENDVLVRKLRAEGDKVYADEYGKMLHSKATEAMAKAHLAISRGQLAVSQENLAESKKLHDAPAQMDQGQAKSYSVALQAKETADELKGLGPMSASGANILRQQLAREEAAEKVPGYKAVAMGLGGWKTIEEALAKSGDPKDLERFVLDHRFATIKLREDSGASIAPSEYAKHMREFTAQVGDNPRTLDGKVKAKDNVVRGFAIRSGKPESFGYEPVGGVVKPHMGQQPNGTAKPGAAKSNPAKSIKDFADNFKL